MNFHLNETFKKKSLAASLLLLLAALQTFPYKNGYVDGCIGEIMQENVLPILKPYYIHTEAVLPKNARTWRKQTQNKEQKPRNKKKMLYK